MRRHHALLTGVPGLVLVALLSEAPAPLASASSPPGDSSPTAPTPVAPLPLPATPQRTTSEARGEWPLLPVPEVVAEFDPPTDPWGSGHRGVDLLGSPGQQVRSALPGRVTFAGSLAGRGVVVVDHGATRTTYEPVDAAVSVGDAVAAGDRLGTLAPVGSHCPPHACLHWGWLRGEEYLDPLDLVGAGPVRLLPLWQDAPATVSAAPPALPYAGWRPWLEVWAG